VESLIPSQSFLSFLCLARSNCLAARDREAGDLIVCELGSDHEVTEIRARSLSNTARRTHTFEVTP